MQPIPAGHQGGAVWVMGRGIWRKCLCRLPGELSLNEWSVFINLELLPCQKERPGNKQGEGWSTKPICIRQAYSFHSALGPLPQPATFTVRPFNFPEIGLGRLCHADEEVLHRVAACHISSISALHLPYPVFLLFFLGLFLLNKHLTPYLSRWCWQRALIDAGKGQK